MLAIMRQQLAADEAPGGVPVLRVYDDRTGSLLAPGATLSGHPTIGIGRALDVRGVTPAEAQMMFCADVALAESSLGSLFWYRALDPVRQGVAVNMAFQLGVAGLLQFREMIEALAAGDWVAAQAQALDSDWARDLAADGSTRAVRLAGQLRTGEAIT